LACAADLAKWLASATKAETNGGMGSRGDTTSPI
jgi:hypothetical protein